MTSKLPWATVTIIIVAAAAVGAWKILVQPETVLPPPTTGYATITAIAGAGTVFAKAPPATDTASGIENVYIVTHGTVNENLNLSGNANLMGVIEDTGGSTNIAYETLFDIVVAVRAGTDNMAYATKENMNVGLAISGSFTADLENAQDPGHLTNNCRMAAYSWENLNYGAPCIPTGGHLSINAIWDNDGNGYTLPAGGSISLTDIGLFGWK